MAMKNFNAVITLRRDVEAHYELVKDKFIPESGEVCIVDTHDGLKYKVGDGVKTYAQLPFESVSGGGGSASEINFVRGYLFNNKFYTTSAYTVEVEKNDKSLYLDKNNNNALYTYDSVMDKYYAAGVGSGTEPAPSIELYSDFGQNVDGAVTQKFFTNSMKEFYFDMIDTDSDGVVDCLEFHTPEIE